VKFGFLSLILFCLSLGADAKVAAEREWTGSSGKTFRGTFRRMTEGGQKAEFISADGKVLTVALESLIPADRERILNPPQPKPAEESETPGVLSGFKPDASPDRGMIPLMVPKSFGGEAGESLVDALWVSLLWWDVTGVLKVPTSGDLENRAEWLHKKLSKSIAAGGGNVTAEDAKTGLVKYFSEELSGVGACRISIEDRDFTAARLARVTQGGNAVVLRMSMTYENGRDYSVSVVLESMTDEGKFVAILAGRRLSGQIRPMEGEKDAAPGAAPSEYVWDRPQDLPELYTRNQARVFMGKSSWNAAILLKPYVYLTPGLPSPLPMEEETTLTPGKPAVLAPKQVREISPKFPIRFSTSVDSFHECSLADGRTTRGSLVSRGSGQVSLKVPTGESVSIPTRLMTAEENGKVFFWDACRGLPITIPRLDLTYQLITSQSGNFDVNISTEGSLGRVEVITGAFKYVLVFDMKDGAFVSSVFRTDNLKEATRIHIGRFLPKSLLPREIESRNTQKEIDDYLKSVLPLAGQSESAAVPCRRIPFPLATTTEAFRNPEIDFVLSDQPVVIAALFQLLCGDTAGGADAKFFVFTPWNVPQRRESESLFPMLLACRMLPVRMAWENLRNERTTAEYHRARESGKFSIELKRAVVPAAFPPGHFAVLPGARAMAAGSSLSKDFKK
jgi:hypothetical protein